MKVIESSNIIESIADMALAYRKEHRTVHYIQLNFEESVQLCAWLREEGLMTDNQFPTSLIHLTVTKVQVRLDDEFVAIWQELFYA